MISLYMKIPRYTQVTSSDEDNTKTEASKVAVDISEEESCGETVLPDTNVADTGPSDDTTVKQLTVTTDSNEQPEEHGNEDEKLLDTTSLTATVEDASLEDTMNKIMASQTAICNQAVMVVEMDPEQLEVVEGIVNMEEKPCFVDAATQVEISDDNTTHFRQTADNKITSDPLIPALLDELSALK